MDSVNWPDVVAGFLIGLVPLLARQLYIVLKYIRQPVRNKYLGRFWQYHRSTMATGTIRARQIDIRYSLFTDRLVVKSVEVPGDDTAEHRLKYSGRISRRQGMIRYFSLQDPESHERLSWFVIDPFYDPFNRTVGIYLALDLRGLPAAGPMMLSRERVPIDQVKECLKDEVIRVEPLTD